MLVLSSCFDQGDCLITNSNIIRVSVHSAVNQRAVTIAFDTVAVLNDTILYKTSSQGKLALPVDPGVTEMTYIFAYGDKFDTLSLGYDNLSVVLATACGAFPYQRNLVVTRSTFAQDSVVITNPSLFKDVTENVRIYF